MPKSKGTRNGRDSGDSSEESPKVKTLRELGISGKESIQRQALARLPEALRSPDAHSADRCTHGHHPALALGRALGGSVRRLHGLLGPGGRRRRSGRVGRIAAAWLGALPAPDVGRQRLRRLSRMRSRWAGEGGEAQAPLVPPPRPRCRRNDPWARRRDRSPAAERRIALAQAPAFVRLPTRIRPALGVAAPVAALADCADDRLAAGANVVSHDEGLTRKQAAECEKVAVLNDSVCAYGSFLHRKRSSSSED